MTGLCGSTRLETTLGAASLIFRKSKMAKRKAKPKPQKIDGLSPGDVEKIRKAIRQVWSWSYPRKLCIARCTGEDGFPQCEQCKERCPKIFVDHITRVGCVDAGFIERMFTPSMNLQGLCKRCHDAKTRLERKRGTVTEDK
jgi:hypothetical protein